MLDLAIVEGEVVDGAGTPARRADVGIHDGAIVEIGALSERASRELDAEGRIVAPGFIDVHTHYDAQVAWDPFLTPSPFHGVTTALGGNCGFTLAPIDEGAAGYLSEMLARVEGIPLQSIRAGVDLRWRSFGEYLGTLDGNVAINAGFLVGHSTVRRVVMGEDWRRSATAEELQSMATLVEDSISSGALGFSSSWSDTHNDASGDPTPSRFASADELLTLCSVVSGHPGTWLEFIPWASGPFPEERIRLMAGMSRVAGRPLNWNLLLIRPDIPEEVVQNRLSASDIAAMEGGAVFALTLPIPMTMRINLRSGFLFDAVEPWAKVLGCSHAEKVRALRQPGVRRSLADAARRADRIWYDLERLRFEHVSAAAFADVKGMAVADAARRRGMDGFDLMFDVAVADDLATSLVVPPQGDDSDSWRRRAEVWRDERTIVGGSDAGAHVDMLNTFGYFTDLLGPSVRDRQLLPLEAAVKLVTDDAARAFGLRGRGRIAQGFAADIVVFDPATIGGAPVEVRHDLPGGGMRLYNEATGIDIVLVNGEPVVEMGKLTGARPGRVFRSGRDTETVLPEAVAPAMRKG